MAQAFDPAAATAAYLAQLSPEAHAKAQAYTQGGYWLLLGTALVSAAIAVIMLRSGLLVRVRERIERDRRKPWSAVLGVLAVGLPLEAALTLPWSVYASWWREKAYGLTSQSLGDWLAQWAVGAVISIVMTIIVLSVLYALIRGARRTWWLWGSAVAAGFFLVVVGLAPVLIEPLFNRYTPAPTGVVREAVAELARETGAPDRIVIYDGSRQSNRYTANVSGLFGSSRIAMSDVMFRRGADLAEVRAVVGHEIGHYVRGHIVWLAAGYGLLVLGGLFLVDRLFGLTGRLLGAKGVSGIADPAGYPVISMLLAVLSLLATPVLNSLNRIPEADADRFSLEHAREPDGLARALVKTIEYRAATPSRLEEVLFYSHPSVGSRIRRAMEWKARNLDSTAS